MVGTGDRSERIRTYNFPQGRVTDHRINLTLYSLDRVIDGRPRAAHRCADHALPGRAAEGGELMDAARRDARPTPSCSRCGAARSRGAGIETARLDAEVLAGARLRLDRAALYARRRRARHRTRSSGASRISSLAGRAASRCVHRRRAGVLVARFVVTPDVSDPASGDRAAGREVVGRLGRAAPVSSICDLGTGSGCIAVALARELPRRAVWALDVFPAALAVARRNARRTVSRSASPSLQRDLFAASRWPESLRRHRLQSAVRLRRPMPLPPELALRAAPAPCDGGADGLDVIRRLLRPRADHLRRRRLAGHGDRLRQQADAVDAWRAAAGFDRCRGSYRLRGAAARADGAALTIAGMDKIVIRGGRRLKGEVPVEGAKNAALPILLASLLTPERCIFRNVPHVVDVRTTLRLLADLGARVEDATGVVHPGRTPGAPRSAVRAGQDDARLVPGARAAAGALRARARVDARRLRHRQPPGRPAPRRAAAMGARVELVHGYVEAEAEQLHGAAHLSRRAVGRRHRAPDDGGDAGRGHDDDRATRRASRRSSTWRAALTAMGARIEGAGEDVITHRRRAGAARRSTSPSSPIASRPAPS